MLRYRYNVLLSHLPFTGLSLLRRRSASLDNLYLFRMTVFWWLCTKLCKKLPLLCDRSFGSWSSSAYIDFCTSDAIFQTSDVSASSGNFKHHGFITWYFCRCEYVKSSSLCFSHSSANYTTVHNVNSVASHTNILQIELNRYYRLSTLSLILVLIVVVRWLLQSDTERWSSWTPKLWKTASMPTALELTLLHKT